MSAFRNIFACLVHENQECVIDLVRNLQCLDRDSIVLLYNGGCDEQLLNHGFPFEDYGAIVHPNPRPLAWGRLHDFALDCMQFAIDHIPFDSLTIVDSDQVGARPGYSTYLSQFFAANPQLGLAGNCADVQRPNTRVGPAAAAFKEIELWRPLLSRFAGGVEKFVHWVFWPSTVFSAAAARDLTRLFATDTELQDIMARSQIWASEEVIFPTLVALLGYEVAQSPCSYDYVRHRVAYSRRDLDGAFAHPSAYWIHPINRRYDDPLRGHVRARFNHYDRSGQQGGTMAAEHPDPTFEQPLLLTAPILQRMRGIEGWLEDDEADLLIAATARALSELPPPHVLVEVGSYCGRSTVVFGSVLKLLGSKGRVYAIDPHDGVVGALDSGLRAGPSTLARFERNVADAGLEDVIVPIQQRSFDVPWEQPISLLFIDGLHDYANVARDFYHFEPSVVPGGYIAFHDYADYYPGVKAFVNEVLATAGYDQVVQVSSMMLVRKRTPVRSDGTIRSDGSSSGGELAAAGAGRVDSAVRRAGVAGVEVAGQPLVSCIMPTFNRRLFVPQAIRCFLRQDYPNKELIIIDDGDDRADQEVSTEPSIHYVAIDRHLTLGEKRNLAVERSAGALIAHWDDDDWYAPGYLTSVVRGAIEGGPESLTGMSRYLVYMLSTGELKLCSADGPAGASFCYWKPLWLRYPYRKVDHAEDYFFLKDAQPRIHRLVDPELFAIVRHRHHTWALENGRSVDERLSALPAYARPLQAVVSADDLAFYSAAHEALFDDAVHAMKA